jgi:hypothetical protein
MKKKLLITTAALVVAAVVGIIVFRNFVETNAVSAQAGEVSEKAAQGLQIKIDEIKKAEESETAGNSRPQTEIEVSDTEMESYVLYSLKQDIPVQMDSFDVQLTPGSVAADTQLTFASMNTGNPLIDGLVSGTHNLFVKGRMFGADGRGKFDLEEVRIDGIPVPRVLIETLFAKYVKPKYPDADLKEPFDLPWGIEELTIEEGKAKVKY